MLRRPPRSTRTTTLPYTTRFRSAQGDALLLATRQRPRTALQQRLDAEQGDHPLEAERPLGRRRPAEAVEQVVAHRKVGKKTAFLAHVAEAPTLRRNVDAPLPIEPRLSAQTDQPPSRTPTAPPHLHHPALPAPPPP